MASAATSPPTIPIPAPQAAHLLSSFSNFLALSIHSLLYHRGLYPPTTFLTARAYNLPVHQSRHPGVCAWVRDAVAAVSARLRAGGVRSVALVVHAPPSEGFAVAERWVFDVASFPAFGKAVADPGEGGRDIGTGTGGGAGGEEGLGAARPGDGGFDSGPRPNEENGVEGVNWVDVNESLRGALRRIAYAAESKSPVQAGCTFTLAVELQDGAPAPIEHPQAWIPSEPNLQPPSDDQPQRGSAIGGASTMPVRAVRAGPLFFECWVEEGGKKGNEDDDGQEKRQYADGQSIIPSRDTQTQTPSS